MLLLLILGDGNEGQQHHYRRLSSNHQQYRGGISRICDVNGKCKLRQRSDRAQLRQNRRSLGWK